MNDQLRKDLSRLDPMHSGVPTEPPTSTSSQHRLERIMSTSTERRAATGPKARRPWMAASATLAAAALVIVGIVTLTGNPGQEPGVIASPALELSLGDGNAMMSCLPFDVAILADMPVAFEGTATAVEGDQVTLTVDRWYKGGEAAQVSLIGTAGMEALIGGITFQTGGHYLITAVDGTVNYCGFSGEATPELRAAFGEAFGG